jgi:hypothetical protein
MKIETCVWRTCPECQAPLIRPLPDGWTFTVEHRKTGIHRVMTHLPQCEDGFKKVKLFDDDE